MVCQAQWGLRRASNDDVERLYNLLGVPEVYHYLTDGVALPRWRVEQWIELACEHVAEHGMGLWMLEDQKGIIAGCVELKMEGQPGSAELT